MTNQSYKSLKQSSAFLMTARCNLPDEGQNEQHRQQLANHSSDNTETACCLTPFSHAGDSPLSVIALVPGLSFEGKPAESLKVVNTLCCLKMTENSHLGFGLLDENELQQFSNSWRNKIQCAQQDLD